jgi:hypothetical protein
MTLTKENYNDRLFQAKNGGIFLSLILLTMTFCELVIRFPSLSWHHIDTVFVNRHSYKTDTQYTCL